MFFLSLFLSKTLIYNSGPPIIAHINGIRHEIRLTGTAPEVKIEPEPAYDLARFLNKMREERQQPAVEQPKQKR